MRMILDNRCNLIDAPDAVIDDIRQVLSMQNPAYIEAVRHGRWTGNIPERLEFFELSESGISFPRGAARMAYNFCEKHGVKPEIHDLRRTLPDMQIQFKGTLRDYQTEAFKAVAARPQGVLEAATGSGKTVIALAVIAERKQPTLILVHTRELMNQWADRIRFFLGVEPGQIGGGTFKMCFPVTVGIVNTVVKRLDDLAQNFGQIIIDECHRCPSSMFTQAVTAFDARYLMGLSATPYRRDGLGKLINWTLGDLVHKVDPELLRENGAVLKPEIVTSETEFRYAYDDDYTRMISALTQDQDRNLLIAEDIARNTNGRGISLVVSDRVKHLETLASMIRMDGKAILTGKTPIRQRERIVNDLAAGKVRVLFSTVSLIGEGFDAPGLCDLYLATPVKFKGRLIQMVGRILRPQTGKRPRVFDYVDARQPVLAAQARARRNVYEQIGEVT